MTNMTNDELKSLVADIAKSQKELVEQQKRTDAQIAASSAALDTRFAATDARLAELAAQLAKTDAQLAKTDAQLAATDAQLAATEALVSKVARKIDRLGEMVGNISNNQGDIAEEFFYTSFLNKPELGRLRFHSVRRNLNNRKGNIQDEYDLVLINGDSLVVFEVKAKAHQNDLERMITRKMPNFSLLFEEFSHYHLYAGIATLATNQELIAKAQELGLYLITQQGNHQIVIQEGRELEV